jgi:hypothetical protein
MSATEHVEDVSRDADYYVRVADVLAGLGRTAKLLEESLRRRGAAASVEPSEEASDDA